MGGAIELHRGDGKTTYTIDDAACCEFNTANDEYIISDEYVISNRQSASAIQLV